MVAAGATSTLGEADVRLARARGEQLPPDCVYDRYGRPSTDPDDLFAGGGLAPLGGAVAGRLGTGPMSLDSGEMSLLSPPPIPIHNDSHMPWHRGLGFGA